MRNRANDSQVPDSQHVETQCDGFLVRLPRCTIKEVNGPNFGVWWFEPAGADHHRACFDDGYGPSMVAPPEERAKQLYSSRRG